MLSGQVKMYPENYYIRLFNQIEKEMIPNKLYNARSIWKLIKSNSNVSHRQIQVMLNYARNNNLIYSDSNFATNIIYWRRND
jgi:hypothetical protein